MAGSVVWVDVLPSMSKFGREFIKGAGTSAKAAGVSAGRQFATAMNAGSMKGTGDSVVRELEAAAKRAAKAVNTEKAAIQKARAEEKAAAAGVEAAEAKLAASRTSKSAGAAKALAAAEQQLITAQTRQEGSTLKVQAAEARLAAARAGTGKGAAASVLKAEQGLSAAMGQQKLTTHQLQVAETGLADVRSSSSAADASILKGEQQLITARGRQESAALRVVSVEDRLKAAFNEQKTVTGQLAGFQNDATQKTSLLRGGFTKLAAAGEPLAGGLGRVAGGAKRIAVEALGTLKPLASMAAGFGAIIGIGKVVTLGNEYTRTMNELGAVTNSSAADMMKASEVSRALGSDLSLPATSGADAAKIMVELAKGGLSLSGSMNAAKGSIQLAAAAQVDGATAAEIQANAINQFGLATKDAGLVADVLANTANAAAGGVTDIATSLKYVGPVARALGIDIEDTASSIGLLANNGLKGDTAGTALRGMLASLARPSKQAQKGVDALGLSVFDSQGKFVGMRKVIESLSEAQKNMTQEDFAAQAVLAFGREPLAAVTSLAAGGAKAFDHMADSVGRQGGASAVAQSQMKGLGGAMDKLESQLEDVALGIYQTVTPALEAAVNGIAGGLDGAGDKVQSFLNIAGGLGKLAFGGRAQAIPAMPSIPPAVIQGILTAHDVVMAAFGDIRTFVMGSLIPSLGNVGRAVAPVAAILGGALLGGLRIVAWVLSTLVGPALKGVTGFFAENQWAVLLLAGVIGTLVTTYYSMKVIPGIVGGVTLATNIAKRAQEGFALASYGSAAAMEAQGKAGKAGAAGFVLWKGALTAGKAVGFAFVAMTRGMAAAQIAFNIAASANPLGLLVLGITLVVAAVAALVAGVIWAYNNVGWFRDLVQGAFSVISTAAQAVGGWFVWLWNTAVMPALNAIGAAVSYVWSSYISPIFQLIGAITAWVGRAFLYLWRGYISPVFQLIGAIISWFWSGIVAPLFGLVVGFIKNTLGATFSWLWLGVIKPVFGFIGAAISVWWTSVKMIFGFVVGLIKNTLGPVFTWLYRNAVKPAIDAIGAVVRTVWNSWLKPVFDKIINVAKVVIPAAFTVMKDGIGKAFDLVKTITKIPIRFVIDTVINDGIIGNFNKVAKFFHTDTMPKVALPKGFAGGGYTGDGPKHQPKGVVHGGEFVLTKDETSRLGIPQINAFRSGGLPGYAGGGFVSDVKANASAGWDWIAGKAGKAWDWAKNTAETAASVVSDPMGTLGKLVKGVIGKIPGAGGMLNVAKGVGSKILSGAVEALKGIGGTGAAGTFGGNGQNGQIPSSALGKANGFAPGPGVNASGGLLRKAAAAAWNAAQRASGGILSLTEGYRDLAAQRYRWGLFQRGGNLAAVPGTSKHGLGLAADVAGGQSWLRSNGARFGWSNTGLGFSQREPWHFEFGGMPAAAGSGGGRPALYDDGGILPTGLSLVANKTGKPEAVLTPEQWRAIRDGRSGGGDGGPHFHYEGREFTVEDYMEGEHRMEVLRG